MSDDYIKLMGYCKVCEETGCHEWVGGYGGKFKSTPVFHLRGTRMCKRSMAAYKAAWILTGRPLKDGQSVYRKCLNNKCINPEHCAAGTPRQMWDFIAKSGKHKGSHKRQLANLRNGEVQRLPVEKVREVEALISMRLKRVEISERTGVNVSTITDIRHGRHFHCASRQNCLPAASVFTYGMAA